MKNFVAIAESFGDVNIFSHCYQDIIRVVQPEKNGRVKKIMNDELSITIDRLLAEGEIFETWDENIQDYRYYSADYKGNIIGIVTRGYRNEWDEP